MITFMCQGESPFPEASVGFLKHALKVHLKTYSQYGVKPTLNLFLVWSETKRLAINVCLLALACQWLALAPSCSVQRSLAQAQSILHKWEQLNSDFIFLEPKKAHLFIMHLNFHFQNEALPFSQRSQRGLFSMPWIDEVWIKPDIERSSVLQKGF